MFSTNTVTMIEQVTRTMVKSRYLPIRGVAQGGGRVDLGDQQEKDVERVEDGDTHGDLLPRVGWDVEDEEGDGADGDTREDEVDRIEEGLPPYRDVELDVRVRLLAARIVLDVLLGRYRQQIPLGTLAVVAQVDAVFDHVQVVARVREVLVPDIDRVPVVSPRTDLERAQLFVEGEEFDVDRTQTFVDRRGLPDHQARVVYCRLRHQLHREVPVSAS